MNPRIASIENLIARDPGERNIFGLVIADQLRLAAQTLRLAKRVGIVSGFYVPDAQAGETDGPPGAKVLGSALEALGIQVDYVTDTWNEPLFDALGLPTVSDPDAYLEVAHPTHLVSIERVGRGPDGRYRNMRGVDISSTTAPLDELFERASRQGITTIGIGDGGNEIGMGRVFATVLDTADPNVAIPYGSHIATTVSTDFCIAAGVSNWGAYGLAGALSVLVGRDLLPSARQASEDIRRLVRQGGAVDGVTRQREQSVDGMTLSHSIRMLENIRQQIAPSPLARGGSLDVGVLGYGKTGRAAAALLQRAGHRVRISDTASVTLDAGTTLAGVETGGHSIRFLKDCDLVVASPGVRPDAPIRDELHHHGVPVMSEIELAYQVCDRSLIAVTGTVGKRTTVELLRRLFEHSGRALTIGGNRGLPLSALLCDESTTNPIAAAVSSFQLETVIHFRPHVAILLNIDEAHLDRHRTIAEYVRTKSRIFMNHHPDDVLILNYDDERLRPLARKHPGRTFYVSSRQSVDRGAWLADGRLHINLDGSLHALGAVDVLYPTNLLAAVVACRISGIDNEPLAHALEALTDTQAHR